jgi:molecular chaperone GrpE
MKWSRKVADKETGQPEHEAGEEAMQSQEQTSSEVEGAEASSPDSTDEQGDEPTLEEMVTKLQDDVAAAKDAALRAQADAQNVKRRAEQDVEKARKFALESFSKELLPVVDNLERALESASGDEDVVKPIAEGVELTLKSFLDALTKFNVAVVDPVGEPFDPNLHQAMSMIENPDAEPNTVLTVLQKGYTLNGRLVRPAMVMVSKSPT